MKKLPPVEKVFEAWTAISDKRIDMHADYADVSSSDGEKHYVVRWSGDQYSSDDNATYWQGYAGYPVIAVLMLQGKLPLDNDEAKLWKDINWTRLNKQHKNNYAEAVKEIALERGINLTDSYLKAEEVISRLSQLPLQIKRKIKL